MAPTAEQVEYSLNNHKWMSYSQAKLIMDMVNERLTEDDPRREDFRAAWKHIDSMATFQMTFDSLKGIPTLAKLASTAPALRPTEEGYYRNPESGELYRITKGKN